VQSMDGLVGTRPLVTSQSSNLSGPSMQIHANSWGIVHRGGSGSGGGGGQMPHR